MADMPGYSGLLGAALPRINQWQASRGRRITPQIVQGLLQADLDKSKQFAMLEKNRQQQMAMEQQRIDIAKDQQKDQQMAGMVGGAGQLLQLPIAYGAAKSMGWFGAPTAAGGGAQAAVAPAVAGAPAQAAALGTPAMATAPALSTGALPAEAAGGASPGLLGGASLPGLGLAAGAFAANVGLGKALQPTMDKIGLPTAGKWGTYAGLPGMVTGATVDIGKKVYEGAKDFISKVF